MNNSTLHFPFYAKFAFTLLSLVLILGSFYLAQSIVIPLLMSLLFAILLRPVVIFFNLKLHLPHVIAVILSVILFVLFFVGIMYFISLQIGDMANDWGKIKQNVSIHANNLQEFVRERFNLSKTEQKRLLNDATKGSMETGKQIVSTTLLSFSDVLVNLMLIPIYTFLILLYRTHFIKFLCKLFKPEHHLKLREILKQIKVSVQSYIVGLLIEMVVVSVLTAVGFMIIGLKYAILLGILTGLLNLIPYIGILIAGVISVVASLTGNADLSIVLGILIVNVVVQLIDNNLLVPMIVSSKVEINALVSIVGIIIGGALGGFSGMFLAIPLIAILKVIFDKIESLEPWGYLMGDDLPKTYEWRRIKLPQFHDNATDTINVHPNADVKIFTETTTKDNNQTQ
ncbi:AI-2E family transporter [Flavobacterium noncentrifugens]|uniref:Predicted PurR-regulated permease PerM n=1 Tax=Flavobacterium noncentrifugens TaxID=1128970 RepID=A0A1G9BPQ7_9FLAO|nr:AI-2E family transporter [Flavobacterium noncentrifugens]SDK41491.1 Predicted PurR-regulated permease PerM [Flavobacterium noncentrifugens]